MKKKIVYLTILICFVFCLFLLLTQPEYTIFLASKALRLWREKLFPSLFPFLVLGEMLIVLGVPSYLSYLLEWPFQKLFHLNGKASFLLLMSMISGFPSGPKYTKSLYEKKEMTKEEANQALRFVHFSNPLFVLGTVYLVLQNKKVTYLVFFSHILSNFIVAFLRRGKAKKKKEQKTNILTILQEKSSSINSLGSHLLEAIDAAMQTMLFMLGSVTFFMLVASIFTQNIPSLFTKSLITGLFDLTSGIFALQTRFLPIFIKGLLATLFLTFGSFSVHLQVLNVLKETDLSYKHFFLGRIEATFIAVLLFSLLYIIDGTSNFQLFFI